MPDISKCPGGTCPKKESCYRFRAIPSEYRQSYFAEPPWDRKQFCDYFWQVQPGDRVTPLPEPERKDDRYAATDPTDNRVAHPPAEPKARVYTRKTGSINGFRPKGKK